MQLEKRQARPKVVTGIRRESIAAPLFDHLVGALLQRQRHGEAKRLGGLEVDNQFVLGRRLHGEVGRPLAPEDAVDVAGRLLEQVEEIRSVGDQAAGGDEVASSVDRGQFVLRRQRDDQIAMSLRQFARRHAPRASRPARSL
jgi:hypothetical protein